ncbi:Y-family DNA polymerase [Flagellimonas sp. HMM57]|uniref:Y-family DNA polymerase n=1 Tax=unclassified Flagellimonas TaxID=2644544 RepID=UPI0013D66F36|nr:MULTISPECIES: Y-family DNA polymerase [unclassified Flagellimonas]UII77132.1 Y-family DNA polymerase [Flagellimonas sp. HMM57]
MFALVDCNNFYASCERAFQPQYNDVPVAILSNNDGCFISRSDEAKRLGLPMAAPAFKYRKFCDDNGIKVFSSNYPLYGDMSKRVMNILSTFTPDVEVYSIDEAFLKFEGFEDYDFKEYGKKIQYKVQKSTGIPISIGIAPTKALAKVANKIAKKFRSRTHGVFVIGSDEERIKAIKWTKIETVWGIGHGNLKRLKSKNVKTAYDFIQLSDDWVKKQMAIIGLRLKKDLEGIPTLDLDDDTRDRKAIATTRSFEYTYSDIEDIEERISTFASSCAEKLRSQKSSCNHVWVFLRSNKHKKNELQDRANNMVTLPYATDSSLTISAYAIEAVREIFKPGIKYKKAGVIVSGLVPTDQRQLDLFLSENPKHNRIMQVMDRVNDKYGYKLKIANQDLERTWKMRQEHLSPKYTTNINDIIKVK